MNTVNAPDGHSALLPVKALAGQRVGVSVSDSADLVRLGLLPSHFKLALRELARTILVSGGTLAYGGHLLPGGYTEFLIGDLPRYAQSGMFGDDRRNTGPALLVCLAHQEHRYRNLTELDEADAQLGLYGELRCLDLEGTVIDDRTASRGAAGQPYPADKELLARGLTALRRYMTDHTAARMLLGGKRHGYTGTLPGVLEEALLALQAGQPLYLAAGFGGVTLDMAGAIDSRCAGHCPRHAQDRPPDPATEAGLEGLRDLVAPGGWDRLNNGLDADENLRLATTHRPAEISSLVALGLGRWAQASGHPQQSHGR